jgi:ribosome recycling factor
MLKEVHSDAEGRMKGAIQALEEDLGTIRTGRASPSLIEKLQVEYYGSPTPLMQLATITVPEARSLLIRPFDALHLENDRTRHPGLRPGLTPNNDGKSIR